MQSHTRSPGGTTNNRQAFTAANLTMSPVKSAEVAQARIFERILQAEFAQLTRAYSAAGRRNHLNETDFTRARPSHELVQMHARIDEVHRLLQRLKGRFQLPAADEGCADPA